MSFPVDEYEPYHFESMYWFCTTWLGTVQIFKNSGETHCSSIHYILLHVARILGEKEFSTKW